MGYTTASRRKRSIPLAELEVARGDHLTARVYLADAYPVHHIAPFRGDVEELRAPRSTA